MDVYQIVTDKIIGILEQGTIPWRKPWTSSDCIPKNLITRKEYRGINFFLLGSEQYNSPYWLTYKQVVGKNGNVRKGEKAPPVVFYQTYLPKGEGRANDNDADKAPDLANAAAKVTGKVKPHFMLRYYHVFNLEQCEGIAAPPSDVSTYQFTPIEKAEQIVTGMKDPPEILYGGDKVTGINKVSNFMYCLE